MIKQWRQRIGVKGFGPGIHKPGLEWYVRLSPNFGFSFPWFGNSRVRYALHHGLQRVVWSANRWVVDKQLLGRSKVKGEVFAKGQ